MNGCYGASHSQRSAAPVKVELLTIEVVVFFKLACSASHARLMDDVFVWELKLH